MGEPDPNPNFVVIYLCDNDFGRELDEVGRILQTTFGREPMYIGSARLKEIVVELMVALNNLHTAYKGFSSSSGTVRAYLQEKVSVEFYRRKPDLPDHDGGSVAISRRDGFVYRF